MRTTRCTWLSVAPSPPRRWDLSLAGWQILPEFRVFAVERAFQVILDWRVEFRCQDWLNLRGKHRAMVLGVEDAGERARLLNRGFGAVLHHDTPLDEVASRLASMRSFFGGRPVEHYSPPARLPPKLDLPFAMTQTDASPELRIPTAHEQYRPRHH